MVFTSPDKIISSTKNPLVRHVRAVAAGDVAGFVVAEGLRLAAEALSADIELSIAIVSPRLRDVELRRRLQNTAKRCIECTDAVMLRMSSVDAHQGLLIVAKQRTVTEADLLAGPGMPLVVVAAGVADPGNLGALVRASEAASASGLISLQGGADPFREKAIRGSMGSIFRLPVVAGYSAAAVLSLAQAKGLTIMVADAADGVPHTAVDLCVPLLLVVGAEGAGVPDALLEAAAVRISIPMRAPVESLNVTVAAAVILYEAQRQRSELP